MFSITKKISGIIGLLTITAGAFDAVEGLASENLAGTQPLSPRTQRIADLESKVAIMEKQMTELQKQLNSFRATETVAKRESYPFMSLPRDLRVMLLTYIAANSITAGESFGVVASVSRQWKIDLRTAVNQGLQPWQPCWRAYLGVTPTNEQIYRTFYNATLECRHNPADKDPAYTQSFLPLMNLSVRALDLPAAIEASKYVLITDKLQQFFEVGGSKVHILIATKSMISMRMSSMKMSDELKVELNKIMASWNDSVAPAGIFWRWSDDKNLTWLDYLITRDLAGFSEVNLFEHWKKRGAFKTRRGCGVLSSSFHVSFLNSPKIIDN